MNRSKSRYYYSKSYKLTAVMKFNDWICPFKYLLLNDVVNEVLKLCKYKFVRHFLLIELFVPFSSMFYPFRISLDSVYVAFCCFSDICKNVLLK